MGIDRHSYRVIFAHHLHRITFETVVTAHSPGLAEQAGARVLTEKLHRTAGRITDWHHVATALCEEESISLDNASRQEL